MVLVPLLLNVFPLLWVIVKKKKLILYVGTQNAFIKASLCLGRNDLCSIKAQLKCLLAPYLPRKNILFSSSEHSCLDIEQCFL